MYREPDEIIPAPHAEKVDYGPGERVLLDNGPSRVVTHSEYGVLVYGGVRCVVVNGVPAFAPMLPEEADIVPIPDDAGELS